MTKPAWRSLLFVPGDQPRLVAKAIACRPDAVILDLEDGVALGAKAQARAELAAAAQALRAANIDVLVRINSDDAELDLQAAVIADIGGIVVPKARSAVEINALSQRLGVLEHAASIPRGAIGLLPLIESPAGVLDARDIAGAERVRGLALGSEDFAVALGAPPSEASLDLPCKIIALSAAAAGVAAFGLPISVGAFRDMQRYEAAAHLARAIGVAGALCIHPTQVAVVNRVFAPSQAEIDHAKALLAVWDQAVAAGRGAIAFEGAMVDAPVAKAARDLLDRSARA